MNRLRLDRLRAPAAVLLLALGLAACEEEAGLDPLSLEATGTVRGILLFDANGSGVVDGPDEPLEDWTLTLEQPAGGVVATDETDDEGAVTFEDVPIGRFVLAVGEEELGDTLSAVESTAEPFILAAGGEGTVRMLLTLDSATVRGARESPPGRPIFVTGVALNALSDDVRDLHLRAGGDYIRVVDVEDGGAGTGDSVRVRGRTDVEAGVPVLDGQEVFGLGSRGVIDPVALSTAEAADARGGSLDAALVRIDDAELVEVEDLGNDGIRLRVTDGTAPVDILLRPFLDYDPDDFDPDEQRVQRATGLLVPAQADGRVTWQLLPRARNDLALQQQ